MGRIELSTRIAAPQRRCFDLSRSVELHLRSTARTGERAIAGRTSGLLALDDEVTWRARHFGLSLTLTSRITRFEPPGYFRDSMIQGPLARLEHDHYFATDGEGATVMRDVFDFSAPLAVLGRIAEALVVTRHFRNLLETRNRELKRVAESEAWREFV